MFLSLIIKRGRMLKEYESIVLELLIIKERENIMNNVDFES